MSNMKNFGKYPPEKYSASELVEIFTQYGGDVVRFTEFFYNPDLMPGEYNLSRVLCILNQKGNEEQFQQWLKIEYFASQSKLFMMRSQAIENLKKMPMPSGLKESTKMIDWKYYVEIWTKMIGDPRGASTQIEIPQSASFSGGEMSQVADLRRQMEAHAEANRDEDEESEEDNDAA